MQVSATDLLRFLNQTGGGFICKRLEPKQLADGMTPFEVDGRQYLLGVNEDAAEIERQHEDNKLKGLES